MYFYLLLWDRALLNNELSAAITVESDSNEVQRGPFILLSALCFLPAAGFDSNWDSSSSGNVSSCFFSPEQPVIPVTLYLVAQLSVIQAPACTQQVHVNAA